MENHEVKEIGAVPFHSIEKENSGNEMKRHSRMTGAKFIAQTLK
jgi:hypothetical protein